ncbi:hypothetical protein LGT39_14725 [Demequina sp. TTPB684]|uniref:hypothetical protein n=1 Tax=unclassified Demequina TaxID=2620311 RepID=UPI001CF493A4|nr:MULTISPECIES: hypothetical protein [unclassified Demequina]MCB2414098.1 hypothetical protein [Demequina sp. TTPB684]UPU89191.1 hypothetical protein LGT36_004490 [Demequina sp. TMPB413]
MPLHGHVPVAGLEEKESVVVNIYGRATPIAIGTAARTPLTAATGLDPATPEAVKAAHHQGRIEAVAQALAVIGTIEGTFRVDADGDTSHPSFTTADLLRQVALQIREEVFDPTSRSTLEIAARANEAHELSNYVLEVSSHYAGSSNNPVSEALTFVASDIRKGTEGVNKLRQASSVETEPELLTVLAVDEDDDVRWWAAQNPATPAEGLLEALHREKHPMVLTALLANPRVPADEAEPFVTHSARDVSRVAQRRLSEEEQPPM